jgi:hypothetical protein
MSGDGFGGVNLGCAADPAGTSISHPYEINSSWLFESIMQKQHVDLPIGCELKAITCGSNV